MAAYASRCSSAAVAFGGRSNGFAATAGVDESATGVGAGERAGEAAGNLSTDSLDTAPLLVGSGEGGVVALPTEPSCAEIAARSAGCEAEDLSQSAHAAPIVMINAAAPPIQRCGLDHDD
jgi:hypothetical protein